MYLAVCIPGCFLFDAAGAALDSVAFDNVMCTCNTPFDEEYNQGYKTHRFSLYNSDVQEKQVVLNVGTHYRGVRLTRKIQLAPNAHMTVYVPQPAMQLANGGAQLWVNNKRCDEIIQMRNQFSSWNHNINMLVSSSLNRDTLNDRFEKLKTTGGTPYPTPSGYPHHYISEANFIRSDTKIDEWADTWLAYTPFWAVFMTADEYEKAGEKVKEALLTYVRAGGVIHVCGDVDTPDECIFEKKTSLSKEITIGFGKMFVYKATTIENIPEELLKDNLYSYSQTVKSSWIKRENCTFEELYKRLPVLFNLKVNYALLFGALLVLMLLLGPVNIFVLAKINRRIWVFWTTPLIALIVFVAVFTYSRIMEGTTSRVTHSGITFLDQRNRNCVSLALTGYYCPVLPDDDLHFSELTEIVSVQSSSDMSQFSETIDWTRDQRISKNILPVRFPKYFAQRTCETRRERLNFTYENNTYTVMNGLGAHIRQLWFVSPDGNKQMYAAENITPGATMEMQQKGAHKMIKPLSELITGDFANSWDAMANNPQSFIEPGMYVAELTEAPFIENGILENIEVSGTNWVIGITQNSTTP